MEWADQKCRCSWASPKNERYIRYHDEEWGIPVRDDSKLLEMLILESFQEMCIRDREYIMTKWGVGYYFAGENQPTV